MPRGKYQLAGIHKFINALTTHSELITCHPPSECSRMQLCKHRSQAGVTLPEISGHGPIFSVYSSVYAIVEVNGRRWELGIKHRR